MMRLKRFMFGAALLLFSLLAASQAAAKPVMGWLERITLLPSGVTVKAKLDTGAKTSSLHARQIERFDKSGERWVRFVFSTDTSAGNGEEWTMELPLVREVAIKRHGLPSAMRPVVRMEFCLGGIVRSAEFSLVDRGRYNYPVLLGRRFLARAAVVDPAAKYLATEGCREPLSKGADTTQEDGR